MLRNLTLGLLLAGTLAACGSARVIQRNQAGGIIELTGDRNKAMEQANQAMAGHCGPSNFTIVQEGEEAIGTDTFQRQDTNYGEASATNGRQTNTQGGATTTGQSSTRTATAWRVHYQCGGVAAPPMGGPGPGMPAGPPPGPPPGPAPAPGY
jgi:hypothetical protein